MIKKKSVIEVITDANKEHAATLADLRAKLAEEEANKVKADAKADEAINNGNADAYTMAKDASRTAADKIEFYKIQIKKTEAAPLFDNPADRKAKADEIKRDYEEFKADKLKTAAQLIKDAAVLVEDVRNAAIKSNDVLDILAKNTGTNASHIDLMILNGLWQSVYRATEHVDIKPYV